MEKGDGLTFYKIYDRLQSTMIRTSKPVGNQWEYLLASGWIGFGESTPQRNSFFPYLGFTLPTDLETRP